MAIVRKIIAALLFGGFYFICDILVISSLYPLKVSGLEYKAGKKYYHQYLNDVIIDGNTGFELSAQVEVSVIWQDPMNSNNKLVKLQVIKPYLSLKPSVTTEKKKDVSSLLKEDPSYFLWSAGKVNNIYISNLDTTVGADIKKGIASLFILEQKSGIASEVDVSGECEVSYIVEEKVIQRTKTNCKPFTNDKGYSHSKKILGVDVQSSVTTKCELTENLDLIQRIISTETSSIHVNLRRKLNSNVLNLQTLNFKEEKSGIIIDGATIDAVITKLGDLKLQSLSVEAKSKPCTDCKSLKALIKEHKEQLKVEHLASLDSAEVFIQLLPHFRQADEKILSDIIKHKNNKEILPQLLDLLAITQTPASEKVSLDFLNNDKEANVPFIERYLLAVSFISHPSENLIKGLLNIVKKEVSDERAQQSFVLALGAIIYTYCQVKNSYDSELVHEFEETVTQKLKNCESEACQLQYIRAFSNAGLPTAIPVLLEYMIKNDHFAIESIQALQRIPKKYITDEVKKTLEKIYYQVGRQFNSTARITAAELLLINKPNPEFVQNIILKLCDNSTYEITKYLLSRLKELSENDQDLRKLLLVAYEKSISANNYLNLARDGFSLAFTKKLAELSDVSALYSLHIENLKTGMLKHSALDVLLSLGDDELTLLSFGIQTEGLEGFGRSSDEESEDSGVMSTAGLTISVMNVLLRPITLFTGMGEVMSLVWQGVGSEPIPALQGILLLHDHHQLLTLQNGFSLQYDVQGALSVDLTGSIQVSLWYRNANSLVTNSGALLIHGNVHIHSPLVSTGVEFGCETESVMSFDSIINFAQSPFKACLLMAHPELKVRHHKKRYSNISDSDLKRLKYWSKITRIPAKTFLLGSENSKRCTIMTQES